MILGLFKQFDINFCGRFCSFLSTSQQCGYSGLWRFLLRLHWVKRRNKSCVHFHGRAIEPIWNVSVHVMKVVMLTCFRCYFYCIDSFSLPEEREGERKYGNCKYLTSSRPHLIKWMWCCHNVVAVSFIHIYLPLTCAASRKKPRMEKRTATKTKH